MPPMGKCVSHFQEACFQWSAKSWPLCVKVTAGCQAAQLSSPGGVCSVVWMKAIPQVYSVCETDDMYCKEDTALRFEMRHDPAIIWMDSFMNHFHLQIQTCIRSFRVFLLKVQAPQPDDPTHSVRTLLLLQTSHTPLTSWTPRQIIDFCRHDSEVNAVHLSQFSATSILNIVFAPRYQCLLLFVIDGHFCPKAYWAPWRQTDLKLSLYSVWQMIIVISYHHTFLTWKHNCIDLLITYLQR